PSGAPSSPRRSIPTGRNCTICAARARPGAPSICAARASSRDRSLSILQPLHAGRALARGPIARDHGGLPGRPFRAVIPARSGPPMTRLRCAIPDDYFDLALSVADWSKIRDRVDITVFKEPFANEAAAANALKDFEIICAMRERTAFPRSLFDALPNLKLLITSGMRNASIDSEAAKDRKVVYCGTQYTRDPTAPLTMGLILELTRGIGRENARMHAGEPWQIFAGTEIEGKTLGVVGLGKLGSKVAGLAKAFGMNVIAG